MERVAHGVAGMCPDGRRRRPVLVIEPRNGWRSLELDECWRYRQVLWSLAWRNIKAAHKQTVLGMGWLVVAPLITVGVYSLVFGRMFQMPSDGYPYPLLAFSGQCLWGGFAAAVVATTGSVVGNAHFIQKIYFPRLLLPISAALNGVVNFLFAFLTLLVMMCALGYWPSPKVILAPAIAALVLATAAGIGMLLAPLDVRYRDIGRLVAFGTQIAFFLTPVLYPISRVPEAYRWLLALNPMVGYIGAFRWSLYGAPLDGRFLVFSVVMTAILVVTGAFYYARAQGRFADTI